MALRDHIHEQHSKAERHPFVISLLSGQLPKEAYAEYLSNQALCYHALEAKADQHNLLSGNLQKIKRASLIDQDASELVQNAKIHDSTREYIEHLKDVPTEQLWAHIYARHFGDMYGGQMLKKVAPGTCRMYEFEDRVDLITQVREKLSDDLADEANRVLGYAIRLFDEIAKTYSLDCEKG